jgi:hypothetical protein
VTFNCNNQKLKKSAAHFQRTSRIPVACMSVEASPLHSCLAWQQPNLRLRTGVVRSLGVARPSSPPSNFSSVHTSNAKARQNSITAERHLQKLLTVCSLQTLVMNRSYTFVAQADSKCPKMDSAGIWITERFEAEADSEC